MRALFCWALLAAACGGSQLGWTPPAPAADEIQVLSPLVKGVAANSDITLCSYIQSPFAETTDVLGFHGGLSPGGHHIVLYQAEKPHAPDTHECTVEDMLNPKYIAGVGADKALNNFGNLPDGVAFRIPAGAQILVQTHWLNATDRPIDGLAAVDLKVAPVSASRVPADLFAIAATNFVIPAGQLGTATSTCPVAEELQMFFIGGHEHKLGTHFSIDHTDTGGVTARIYDHDWQPEYEANPPINIYPKEAPLVAHVGEQLKISCAWDNTAGARDLTFPTEMCASWAFYFPGHGEIDCADGHWPTP